MGCGAHGLYELAASGQLRADRAADGEEGEGRRPGGGRAGRPRRAHLHRFTALLRVRHSKTAFGPVVDREGAHLQP